MEKEGHCARAGLSQISLYNQDSFLFHVLLPSLNDEKEVKDSCFSRNCPVAGFGVCVIKLPLPHVELLSSLAGSCPQLSPGPWMSGREKKFSFARPAVAIN